MISVRVVSVLKVSLTLAGPIVKLNKPFVIPPEFNMYFNNATKKYDDLKNPILQQFYDIQNFVSAVCKVFCGQGISAASKPAAPKLTAANLAGVSVDDKVSRVRRKLIRYSLNSVAELVKVLSDVCNCIDVNFSLRIK